MTRDESIDFVSFRAGYVETVEGLSEKARIESRGEVLIMSPGGGKERTRSYCAREKRLAREYCSASSLSERKVGQLASCTFMYNACDLTAVCASYRINWYKYDSIPLRCLYEQPPRTP